MYSRYVADMQQVKLFEGMTIDEILKVLGCLKAYTKEYTKGSSIYMQGESFDNIGIILEGRVMVNREYHNGSILTINILEQYDTFGEDVICLRDGYAPYSLIANTRTKILYMSGKYLINPSSAKCEYRSRVNLNMLKRMAEYSMYVNKRMKYINILSLKKRVIAFLLDLQEEAGTYQFSIGMNREEMAAYLNGTRVSISRILSELNKEGLVEYRKDVFILKDKRTLIEQLD